MSIMVCRNLTRNFICVGPYAFHESTIGKGDVGMRIERVMKNVPGDFVKELCKAMCVILGDS